MKVVVDANIAAALFLDLAYSPNAREAIASATEIIAPDLIAAEIANTLWKLVASKHIELEFTQRVLDGMIAVISEFVPGTSLAAEAVQYACALDHPAYDCFYLALAKRLQARLLTADRRFAAALGRMEPTIDHVFIE